MSRFLLLLESGPCMGSYEVARAPRTLRAVRDASGHRDVLDLVDDQPRDGEEVFVYERSGERVGHVCTRGRGCYQTVDYRYVGPMDKTTGELRDVSDEDRAWWEEQRMAAMRAWAMGEPAPEPDAQGTLL